MLCKIDGSARRQVVHFIECLYRPPVTRVGVGGTADRVSGLLLLLSDASTGLFIRDLRGPVPGGELTTSPTFLTNLDLIKTRLIFIENWNRIARRPCARSLRIWFYVISWTF